MVIRLLKSLTLFTIITCSLKAQQVNIIPYPASINIMHGQFTFDKNIKIVLVNDIHNTNQKEVVLFNDWLNNYFGYKLTTSNKIKQNENTIQITAINSESEKYELNIQGNTIKIKALGEGLKNAFESLKQLIVLNNKQNSSTIPCLFINDSATFKWRGMHLDVCRHFFTKEEVKRYIDYISMYKMNTFHWHLTDDQGWRIEIKKYPKLTEIGGWRKGSMVGHYSEHTFDTLHYGGFYTQDDIKEVVAYAQTKHVTIVPEIEMPGHAMAALAAYPNYACTEGPFEVQKQWGVFEDVFCPKPETFRFLEDVLTEVMALFPGEYIHIGGDECPKTRWKTCSHCQGLIKSEGLKDEHELQSYFIKHISNFLSKHHKKLIGWDEILEGGIASNAAIMSWRGEEGGIAAAKEKHYAVMTPGAYCYFDHYQGHPTQEPVAFGGYTPLEKVYEYNPIPHALKEEEKKYILGAQGNIWAEYLPHFNHVEYTAFPRIAALSEVLWTPAEQKNLNGFLQRIQGHFKFLDLYRINYSKSIYNINYEIRIDSTEKASLYLNNILFERNITSHNDSIVYQLSENAALQKYTSPVSITQSTQGRAFFYRNGEALGKDCNFKFFKNKATSKKVNFVEPPSKYYNKGNLTDGLLGHSPRINSEWLAWSGKNMDAVIDLIHDTEINTINVGFLKNEDDWIYLPSYVEIMISSNGKDFTSVSTKPVISQELNRYNYLFKIDKQKVRFVKIIAQCAPVIPEGRNGAGNNAWLFVDEIQAD